MTAQPDTISRGATTTMSTTVAQSTGVTTALSTKRIAGPIVALGSNGSFQMKGPTGVGYTWIYPTSTTAKFYQGLQPALNEYAQITATGTAYTPIVIGLYKSAPATPTFTGRITSQQAYGIAVQDKVTGIYVPVALSTSSSVTVALTVGATVTISGPGAVAASTALFANTIASTSTASVTPTPSTTPAPTATATASATATPSSTYPTTAFMPSSRGKISAFQIFDETGNGTITSTAASNDGWRYASVWGVRPGLGSTWRNSNTALRSAYYMLMDTDQSTTAWGAIGHSLTWWQANHPTWVLYECTSTGTPTTTPAYDSGLPNVPLNIRNSSVVNYQIAQQAVPYAIKEGYNTLAVDEVTFWFPGGGHGYYPCGTWSNGTFTRLYSGPNDTAWASDVVNWVKAAHAITKANNMLLLVNHPGGNITTNEASLLANVDADMDETGFTDYGKYLMPSVAPVTREANWMKYAQAHGTAVLINQDWGSITSMGASQKDYSIATYLLGNEQAASLFASTHTGYGVENYYPEYGTAIGSPCGEYYGGSSYSSTHPALYYRKFANAFVVVNAGGSGTEAATLPSGHTYSDIEGRSVTSSLSVAANDGYVLKTTNGCQ
ncbi:MAG: hypothetical protein ABR508_08820 [Candidatus Baltobacteraceae bacterium]